MKIDHIGIATERLEEASALWQDALGLELDSTEEIASQGVRVAMLTLGESHIELLEPLSDDSPVGKFLGKRGPGIHHIAVRVDDIRASLADLKTRGSG
jgi:methylmalonyl-CoA epimerase